MAHLANGRIVLWQGGGLWLLDVPPPTGPRTRTDLHAHHAIQVTLSLGGAFELHTDDGASVAGPGAVVAADVRHALSPLGSIALLFVEPESAAGRRLTVGRLAGRRLTELDAVEASALRATIEAAVSRGADEAALRAVGRDLVARLCGGMDDVPANDPRVAAAIAWAGANLDRRISTADIARHVGLSTDRMSHLFVARTGLPFRTYLLWLRMTRAVEAYAQGAAITTAAYEAGFADSAHFSRTFRRMFGVAAAELRLA